MLTDLGHFFLQRITTFGHERLAILEAKALGAPDQALTFLLDQLLAYSEKDPVRKYVQSIKDIKSGIEKGEAKYKDLVAKIDAVFKSVKTAIGRVKALVSAGLPDINQVNQAMNDISTVVVGILEIVKILSDEFAKIGATKDEIEKIIKLWNPLALPFRQLKDEVLDPKNVVSLLNRVAGIALGILKDEKDAANTLLGQLMRDAESLVPALPVRLGDDREDPRSLDGEKPGIRTKWSSTASQNLGFLTVMEPTVSVSLEFDIAGLPRGAAVMERSINVDGVPSIVKNAVVSLKFSFKIVSNLDKDSLLGNLMPAGGSAQTAEPVVVSIDNKDGFKVRGGNGPKSTVVTIPVNQEIGPATIHHLTLGLPFPERENKDKIIIGSLVSADIAGVINAIVDGAGVILTFRPEGLTNSNVAPLDVDFKEPDGAGLSITAGPITGGGHVGRKPQLPKGRSVREVSSAGWLSSLPGIVPHPIDGEPLEGEVVEPRVSPGPLPVGASYEGMLQLKVLKASLVAFGIISTAPTFSLAVIIAVRFPVPLNLPFGFTLNAVGGVLGLNRTADSDALKLEMRAGKLDKLMFPDNPAKDAPIVLAQMARVFPQRSGSFIVGPMIEIGWGSSAMIVYAKIGVVLCLPDPKMILLGAVRVQAPNKKAPVTDIKCEVFAELRPDGFELFACMSGSTIMGYPVSGDLGMVIQWGGSGEFALSVGGFHPRYREIPPKLSGLKRIRIDFSPPAVLTIIVEFYFAITSGAVMLGVKGDFRGDIGIASAKAWLQIDVLFRWAPTFGFIAELSLGLEVEALGCTICDVRLYGSLEGTKPWKAAGKAVVEVPILPDIDFDFSEVWGEQPAEKPAVVSPLAMVTEALAQSGAWKVVKTAASDALVVLKEEGKAASDALLAHPLGIIEVAQTKVPLDRLISRVGSSPVSENLINLAAPKTRSGMGDAALKFGVLDAPFAPGQYVEADGEALLGVPGFEKMPSGIRLAPGIEPTFNGKDIDRPLKWETWVDGDSVGVKAPLVKITHDAAGDEFALTALSAHLLTHNAVAMNTERDDNPYLSPEVSCFVGPPVVTGMADSDSCTLNKVKTGERVLEDWGFLSPMMAHQLAAEINASEKEKVTVVTAGVRS